MREVICALMAEQKWLVTVRRGPGIAFHIGRRVGDRHLKGLGPNQT